MAQKADRFNRYFEVLSLLDKPNGNWREGEIEIITDPEIMLQAEKKSKQKVGVISEDQYVIHLRDAVWFPPKPGSTEPILATYIRLIYTYELQGNLGVFMLPIHTDGKIVLNRAYRHAVRSWTIEGSGTIAKSGETRIQTIQRCMQSELGCKVIRQRTITEHFLPERGLMGGLVPIHAVWVDYQPKEVDDPTIQGHILMSAWDYLNKMAAKGRVTIKGRQYLCNDGYTVDAVALALRKGLVS